MASTLVEYAKQSKTIYLHNTYVCKSVNSCSIKECMLPRIWNHMSHSNGLSNVLNINYRFPACSEVPQFLVRCSTDKVEIEFYEVSYITVSLRNALFSQA